MIRPCSKCGSMEPFHIHNGEHVIKDYFLIGRVEPDIEAARIWPCRALTAEKERDDLQFRLDSLDK
jgi:hypothetical protein